MTGSSFLSRALVAILAMTLCLSAHAAARDYRLPDLGQPADKYLSPAKEKTIGAKVIGQLREHDLIVEDPQLEEYISRIGDRLARQTDAGANTLHYYVFDQNTINAVALPGGYIGINLGLIPFSDNESQLASVMAHETAHAVQRHIARQIAESRGDSLATLAATIAAAVAGALAGAPDAVPAAITGGISHLGQQQISYTRAHEHEADRVGIRFLANAHYNPEAMANFFQKMQHRARLQGREPPQILLTHPVDSTRMAEAQARAARFGHVKTHSFSVYPLMKARARVLEDANSDELAGHFRRLVANPNAKPADYYGYALALMRLGDARKAIEVLKPRVKTHPDQMPWTLALAKATADSGQIPKALALLSSAKPKFRSRSPFQLAYAGMLLQDGKPGKMRDYLISQGRLLASHFQAQRLLAKGASEQHNLGEAYYRQARYYALRGAYAKAINQLRTALQTEKLNDYNKSRLTAYRNQLTRTCHRAWSQRECRQKVKALAKF